VEIQLQRLDENSGRRLALRLRVDPRPLPVSGYHRGFGTGRPRISERDLLLPLWAPEDWVLQTVRRFYSGPISDEVVRVPRSMFWDGDLPPYPWEDERQDMF